MNRSVQEITAAALLQTLHKASPPAVISETHLSVRCERKYYAVAEGQLSGSAIPDYTGVNLTLKKNQSKQVIHVHVAEKRLYMYMI